VTMASSSSFGCQLSEGFLDDIEHEFRRMEAGGDVDEVQGRLNVLDQVSPVLSDFSNRKSVDRISS
jgi:hypothetical protein